jgi:hypothetical protein
MMLAMRGLRGRKVVRGDRSARVRGRLYQLDGCESKRCVNMRIMVVMDVGVKTGLVERDERFCLLAPSSG